MATSPSAAALTHGRCWSKLLGAPRRRQDRCAPLRVRDRRGQQVAAVATARKLAVIVWYVLTRDEPFAWDRPALTAHKLRALELQAGMPAQHGSRKGSAAAYSLKSVRQQERAVAEQSERTYQRLFNRWKQSRPKSESAVIRWPEART